MKQQGNWLVLAVLISSTVARTAGAQQSQPTPPPILVKSSRLLDPKTGNVRSPAAVLIEDGKIKEVGAPAHVPAGAKTIDLGTATLLPGLIDSHTHLLVDPVLPAQAERARRYKGAFVRGYCWRLLGN